MGLPTSYPVVIGRSVVTVFLNGSVLLYLLSGTISSVFRVWDCRRISCWKKKKEWKKERRRFIRFGDILAFFYSIFSRCILKRTRYLKDPLICFIMLSRQFFIIYTTNFFCAQEIQISQSVIKIYLLAKKINTNLKVHSDFPFCKLSILKQYYFLYNKFQIFQIFLILPSSILFSHLLSLFYSSNTTSILNPRSKSSPIDWRSSIGQKLYSTWAKR